MLTIWSELEFKKLVAEFSFMSDIVAKIKLSRHVEKKRVGKSEPALLDNSGHCSN